MSLALSARAGCAPAARGRRRVKRCGEAKCSWLHLPAPQPAADSSLLRFSVQRFNLSRKIKYSINGNLPTQSRPSLCSRQRGPCSPAAKS